MPNSVFILGGAKSGKSALALKLAGQTPGPKYFIATAQAGDEEMTRRIIRHQKERGPEWTTVEEPLELCRVLAEHDAPGRVLVVDCLTLWLSNLMTKAELDDATIGEEGRELAACIPGLSAKVILVANEVGLGIVPNNALARRFRDLTGGLNQAVASACDQVVLVAAGLSLTLKGPPINLE